MLILVCVLSVSARCVKRQGASTRFPVAQKAAANKVSSQAGPVRKLLEDSSAGSGDLPPLTNTTTTPLKSAKQGGQSNDQQTSTRALSSGSGDTSNTNKTSTASGDNSGNDSSSSAGTPTTSNDDSNKDTSNSEDTVPSSTPSSGSGDTSSSSSNESGKDTSGTDTSSTSSDNSGKDASGAVDISTSSGGGGSGNDTSSTETSSSTSSGGGSGNCGAMKSVCFNGGMNPSMFDEMKSASHWITFGLDIPGGSPSPRAKQAHIPMMAFERHVSDTVKLVNGPDAPEWVLTFNEPDYSYMGWTPTMDGKKAAEAIAPLLAQPGKKTKFVAPVTADPNDPFLEEFFAACNCKDFFSAYNIHSYNPNSADVIKTMDAYHSKWNDKPLWITEIAPGGGCGKSPATVGQFMKDIFQFAKNSGYVDKVFWNTGNQIDAKDTNVCDSWLVDASGKAGPLMEKFDAIDCS
ncbi:MAG: hypothetical protein Q9199_007378 [Rusavskia elegans]